MLFVIDTDDATAVKLKTFKREWIKRHGKATFTEIFKPVIQKFMEEHFTLWAEYDAEVEEIKNRLYHQQKQ